MLYRRASILLFILFPFLPPYSTTLADNTEPQAVPGQVIVKYKPGIMRSRATMNLLYEDAGVKKVHHYSGAMSNFEQLILRDNVPVEKAISTLQESSVIEYAQPNYILSLSDAEIPTHTAPDSVDFLNSFSNLSDPKRPSINQAPPDVRPPLPDPYLDKAYGLKKIQAIEAWDIYKGTRDFVVAVIDTGIDYNHEDLGFNLWRNPDSNDSNDLVGYDFIHSDGLPYDDAGHGTHTAGITGAVGGNGIGISGVSQRVSLMALKFLDSSGHGATSNAIRAVEYAVSHGAKVINGSFSSQAPNPAMRDAIITAGDNGILYVASADNRGKDIDQSKFGPYPTKYHLDNVISVVATDANDDLAEFSNYGKEPTDLAAPGVSIYSTLPDNKYGTKSGTSMAAPFVAGAAALVWSCHSDWDLSKVKEVLLDNTDQIPSLSEKTATGGRLNVLKAMTFDDPRRFN